MALPDDTLVAEYLKGNLPAFERLYDRYASRLLGFVVSLGGPRESCEDVVQKSWIRVLDALPSYQRRGQFRAWLFRIAHRCWLDEIRSSWKSRRISIDEQAEECAGLPINFAISAPEDGPDSWAISREDCRRLYNALGELPDRMRQTVLLRVDGELTFKEIAETMHCPIGTVLWRMKEAERRLRERLCPQKVK